MLFGVVSVVEVAWEGCSRIDVAKPDILCYLAELLRVMRRGMTAKEPSSSRNARNFKLLSLFCFGKVLDTEIARTTRSRGLI